MESAIKISDKDAAKSISTIKRALKETSGPFNVHQESFLFDGYERAINEFEKMHLLSRKQN